MSVIPKDPWAPLPVDWREQLRSKWPDGERLRIAWDLARDVETLADLLAGRAVDSDRLRANALDRAREERLVSLSKPVDLVQVRDAA